MDALITISHGSRHDKAQGLVDSLSRRAGQLAGMRSYSAHLEFHTPDLAEAVQQAVRDGISNAVIVPLLFTEGFHSRVDIPKIFDEQQALAQSHGLTLHRARGLGTGNELREVLVQQYRRDAADHLDALAADAAIVLVAVGSADDDANAAVLDLARALSETVGMPVEVIFATRSPDYAGLIQRYRFVHMLPLFVTHGLLLDRVYGHVRRMCDDDSSRLHTPHPPRVSYSPPLGTALAGIVAARAQPARTH